MLRTCVVAYFVLKAGKCCGSGCIRCVWVKYYEKLDEWESQQYSSGPTATPTPVFALPTVNVQVGL